MIDTPKTPTPDETELVVEDELKFQGLNVTVLAGSGKTRKVIIDDPERGFIYEYLLGIPKLKHRKMIARIADALKSGGNQSKLDDIAKAHGIDPSQLDTLSEDDLTAAEKEILMGDSSVSRTMDVFSEVIYVCFENGKFPDGEKTLTGLDDLENLIPLDHAMALFKPAMTIINASFTSGAERKK